jgi:CotS family spore coat protein
LYIQPETILEQYNLVADQIGRGRGTYICTIGEEKKLLVPFRGSAERAEFLCRVLSYLKDAGVAAEQILRTKEGSACAEDEMGERYLLKNMEEGAECSLKSRAEIRAAVEQLAALHSVLDGCPVEIPEFMKNDGKAIVVLCEKHCRELLKVRNYVKSRKKKNAFEVRFQEQYPHFMECAQKSLQLLGEEMPRMEYRLCHGDFNQHNIVNTKNGWQIVNYEALHYDLSVFDLANFMRKTLEKNNWSCELGREMIAVYSLTQPLSAPELRQMSLLLLFPEKFWKIANHYYNTHKAWISGRDIEKLDKVIAQEENRIKFLENLFSFVE